MNMLQDPLLAAQIGQSPQAQKMQSEIMAHVSEHLAFTYRKKIEEQLGVPMPAPNTEMPEEAEVMLAKMVAMASQQVLAQSKGQAAQQQAQAQAQDSSWKLAQKSLNLITFAKDHHVQLFTDFRYHFGKKSAWQVKRHFLQHCDQHPHNHCVRCTSARHRCQDH
jgi:hypothetical protein